MNKNSLYDSYVRAIRWASDRLLDSPQGGVVAFVTNGGYIDSNTADGVRLTLAEQGHQHVCAGHFVAPAALHMNGGALDDALEAGRGLGVASALRHQHGQILVQEFGQVALELVHIHATGA